jgi:23S rRNA A2030 N6-methylase RlmJ
VLLGRIGRKTNGTNPTGGNMTIEIEKGVVALDDDTAAWLRQYKEAIAKIKEWEEVADIARAHLEVALGDNELAMYQGQPVVRWTTVSTRRFDVKKAREILPAEFISVLETETQSRRFSIVDLDKNE